MSQVDEDFRNTNAIFPQALIGGPGYTNERWEYENACNELGWKLAWLNSAKLTGKRALLHKAVEAYQSRVEAAERARQAVLHHHQQVLGQAYDPSLLYDASALHPHMLHGVHGMDDPSLLDKNEEFSQMVAQALQQALTQGVSSDPYQITDPSEYQHLQYSHAIIDDHQFHDHHHIHHDHHDDE